MTLVSDFFFSQRVIIGFGNKKGFFFLIHFFSSLYFQEEKFSFSLCQFICVLLGDTEALRDFGAVSCDVA